MSTETKEQRIERIAGFHYEQWKIRSENQTLESAFRAALTALCEEMEREREDERIELVMHEVFIESLLDDLKAPKHPDNDPSRPKFGPYGRLRAYAESIGVKASMWEPLPQPPAT